MSDWRIRLYAPAQPEYVALTRSVVGWAAQQAGWDQPGLKDLQLCVNEACANVVRHAYRGASPRGEMRVRTSLATDSITVVIEDDGHWPNEPPRDEDGAGLGLVVIESLADELRIETGRDGRGTRVTITKRMSLGTELRAVDPHMDDPHSPRRLGDRVNTEE